MKRTGNILIGITLVLSAGVTFVEAGLLPDGQAWREIPFEVVDQRPMLPARVDGMTGRMMFDTGTPEAVFLNRDAAPLLAGKVVGNGFAASGQAIELHLHDAAGIEIGGLPFATGPVVISGNFGFVEGLFGADYLGFIGTPAVDSGAFVLDYQRQVLTALRTDATGVLAVPAPLASDIVATLSFAIIRGEQPTAAAFIGSLPLVLDFDTGDSGTLYLRAETRARLEAETLLTVTGDTGILAGVTFGGATFDGLAVRLVKAGGPQDKRAWPGSDALRLGADFLSDHPTLWNFPAGTITVLRQGASFLGPR